MGDVGDACHFLKLDGVVWGGAGDARDACPLFKLHAGMRGLRAG